MFWLAGKETASPRTLQTHINAELEKKRLYTSIYTMDYCEQKAFKRVKFTSGSFFGLKSARKKQKNILYVQKLFLLKTRSNVNFESFTFLVWKILGLQITA